MSGQAMPVDEWLSGTQRYILLSLSLFFASVDMPIFILYAGNYRIKATDIAARRNAVHGSLRRVRLDWRGDDGTRVSP